MKRSTTLPLVLALLLPACAATRRADRSQDAAPGARPSMDLGAFSVSLAVQDLAASRAFYEKLGFAAFAGDAEQGWLILQNGTSTIGLFEKMFEPNILTFNPGWTQHAEPLDEFTDLRELQRRLRASGLEPVVAADESTHGPASLVLIDPDGNQILFDQHVD